MAPCPHGPATDPGRVARVRPATLPDPRLPLPPLPRPALGLLSTPTTRATEVSTVMPGAPSGTPPSAAHWVEVLGQGSPETPAGPPAGPPAPELCTQLPTLPLWVFFLPTPLRVLSGDRAYRVEGPARVTPSPTCTTSAMCAKMPWRPWRPGRPRRAGSLAMSVLIDSPCCFWYSAPMVLQLRPLAASGPRSRVRIRFTTRPLGASLGASGVGDTAVGDTAGASTHAPASPSAAPALPTAPAASPRHPTLARTASGEGT